MIEVDVSHRQGGFHLEAAFKGGDGITALFGPSGSGKSTLIALIAGLRRPERGRIVAGDRVLLDTEARVFVRRNRRRIGLVFQDALLFPHLTVRQNLLFGRLFTPRAERRIRLDPVVETLGIGALLDRRPATLSGGERQRVAFGRALLASPRLLLMDEPLAALDQARKAEVLPLIERLRDEFRIPILYVSHAVEEVARLAATVVMLEAGKVTAVGAPADVLRPVRQVDGNRFAVASVLAGTVGAFDTAYGMTPVHHPAGTIWLSGPLGEEGRETRLVVRGTDVALATSLPRNVTIRTALSGTVLRVLRDDGPLASVDVALSGGGVLTAVATRMGLDDLGLDTGDRVWALIKSVAVDERTAARGGMDGEGPRGPRRV
ncbi:molybdenum ABC transporter ATP-binding protein [Mongoliimonas terrestris]|uniref:molybdenum ABC transporter ATP-binding protein n=1 Tax=Mongoliimonas terrestris TaxID=1709001 RepID=UPI0009499255|nr:molybdenum ABC transporter ATP-binding protein [Mongoliimonas terrestris]